MPYKDKEKQREYHKKYIKEHYKNNKEYYKEKNKKFRKSVQDFILEYKKKNKCIDCGNGDFRILDFDHVEGEKKFNIGDVTRYGYGKDKVKKEIDKCELVCANCHRIRTWERNAPVAQTEERLPSKE